MALASQVQAVHQISIATVEQLDQKYVLMPAHVKDAYLVHILQEFIEQNSRSSVMIFTNTCKYCQILAMVLAEAGFDTIPLHSMLLQRQRLAALAKFKSNQVKVLIATDVASRGLDIPTVDLVINHNVPSRPKDYVHRVGRTARAGRTGASITLVTQFDVQLVQAIETHIGTKLADHPVKENEIAKIVTEVAVAKREAEIKLDEQDFGEKRENNKKIKMIMEGKDPEEEAKKKETEIAAKLKKRKKFNSRKFKK